MARCSKNGLVTGHSEREVDDRARIPTPPAYERPPLTLMAAIVSGFVTAAGFTMFLTAMSRSGFSGDWDGPFKGSGPPLVGLLAGE